MPQNACGSLLPPAESIFFTAGSFLRRNQRKCVFSSPPLARVGQEHPQNTCTLHPGACTPCPCGSRGDQKKKKKNQQGINNGNPSFNSHARGQIWHEAEGQVARCKARRGWPETTTQAVRKSLPRLDLFFAKAKPLSLRSPRATQ